MLTMFERLNLRGRSWTRLSRSKFEQMSLLAAAVLVLAAAASARPVTLLPGVVLPQKPQTAYTSVITTFQPATLNRYEVAMEQRPFDYFMFVRQWPGGYCSQHSCSRLRTHGFQFTIHGLWPNYSDGRWPQFCNPDMPFNPEYINDLVEVMDYDWPSFMGDNDDFWAHEWNRHGTCALDVLPSEHEYFKSVLNLNFKFDLSAAFHAGGILPSSTHTYKKREVVEAVHRLYGVEPDLHCGPDGTLMEIWMCVDRDLKPFTCTAPVTAENHDDHCTNIRIPPPPNHRDGSDWLPARAADLFAVEVEGLQRGSKPPTFDADHQPRQMHHDDDDEEDKQEEGDGEQPEQGDHHRHHHKHHGDGEEKQGEGEEGGGKQPEEPGHHHHHKHRNDDDQEMEQPVQRSSQEDELDGVHRNRERGHDHDHQLEGAGVQPDDDDNNDDDGVDDDAEAEDGEDDEDGDDGDDEDEDDDHNADNDRDNKGYQNHYLYKQPTDSVNPAVILAAPSSHDDQGHATYSRSDVIAISSAALLTASLLVAALLVLLRHVTLAAALRAGHAAHTASSTSDPDVGLRKALLPPPPV